MTIKPNENPRQHQQRLQHQKRSSGLTKGFPQGPGTRIVQPQLGARSMHQRKGWISSRSLTVSPWKFAKPNRKGSSSNFKPSISLGQKLAVKQTSGWYWEVHVVHEFQSNHHPLRFQVTCCLKGKHKMFDEEISTRHYLGCFSFFKCCDKNTTGDLSAA